MITWHKHHIVPRHAGGTDEPQNIIKVNVPMHAFLHRQRYIEHGNKLDKIAADTLSGQKTSTEARCLACRIGRERKSPYKSYANSVIHPKKYVLYSPQGERVAFENLRLFCLENGLQSWNIDKVLKGKRVAHKGWSAKPNKKPQRQGYYKRAYVYLSPDNDIIIAYSVSSLARENNLSQGNLGMVTAGIRKHTKGWRCGLSALDDFTKNIGAN